MANFFARYFTNVAGGQVVAPSSDGGPNGFRVAEFDSPDGVFMRGEQVIIYNADGIFAVGTVLGHTDDGLVVDYGAQPDLGVFGNTAYAQDQAFSYDTTTPLAVCFYSGTAIATPDGTRAVEDLREGDLVIGADGRARPIKWMWRQTVTTVFADPLRSLPVIVRAGALGENAPVRDLIVSPDHALLIDGMLVHAGALENGSSVVRMTGLPAHFTYWHIELEDHALVLAEGVAAETFVDAVTRRRFDNWAEYEARFGNTPAIDPLDLPRVTSARALPTALRARLAGQRAA